MLRIDFCIASESTMDLSKLKVVQLKELLQKRQLPTSGSKAELIARLQKADPHYDWTSDIEAISVTQSSRRKWAGGIYVARDLHDQYISDRPETEYASVIDRYASDLQGMLPILPIQKESEQTEPMSVKRWHDRQANDYHEMKRTSIRRSICKWLARNTIGRSNTRNRVGTYAVGTDVNAKGDAASRERINSCVVFHEIMRMQYRKNRQNIVSKLYVNY